MLVSLTYETTFLDLMKKIVAFTFYRESSVAKSVRIRDAPSSVKYVDESKK